MSSADRRTDGRTDKVNPVYPPPTSLGGGYKYLMIINVNTGKHQVSVTLASMLISFSHLCALSQSFCSCTLVPSVALSPFPLCMFSIPLSLGLALSHCLILSQSHWLTPTLISTSYMFPHNPFMSHLYLFHTHSYALTISVYQSMVQKMSDIRSSNDHLTRIWKMISSPPGWDILSLTVSQAHPFASRKLMLFPIQS